MVFIGSKVSRLFQPHQVHSFTHKEIPQPKSEQKENVLGCWNGRRVNRELFFEPGGSAMLILVPWKAVVLVWGLLSGVILVSFVASSLLEGKDHFAPGTTFAQPASLKKGVAQAGQPKHSHKAARTPSQ
jgi:hypothetical protein